MELAGGELMEKEKVQSWNRASRRGTKRRYNPGIELAGGELMEKEKVQVT